MNYIWRFQLFAKESTKCNTQTLLSLQTLLDHVCARSEIYSLHLNPKKTKFLVVNKNAGHSDVLLLAEWKTVGSFSSGKAGAG